MCTAISLNANGHLFGRNLDLHCSYGEEVIIMPRSYPFELRKAAKINHPYAVIGMGTVVENGYEDEGGFPLFYDGMNECGLAAAGLNFPYNAHYLPPSDGTDGGFEVAPFELIPWVLCQCKTVSEAKELLLKTVITDIPFSKNMPNTPLHWMLSDSSGDIVIESMKDGIHIYDNPVGVLTNNPPFEHQLENLKKYEYLRTENPVVASDFKMRKKGVKDEVNGDGQEVRGYSSFSNGLGTVGLPGDLSSSGRFVRAAFGRRYSATNGSESQSVGQIFHLLSSVEAVRGLCKNADGEEHYTLYSSCMSSESGIYYYTTYGNRQICCVNMHKSNLDEEKLYRFKLLDRENVLCQG